MKKFILNKSGQDELVTAAATEGVAAMPGHAETNLLMDDVSDLQPEGQKKVSKFTYIDYIWTIISAMFAISSACSFVAKQWVTDTAAYVLIVLLAIYIISFIAIVSISFKKGIDKKSKQQVKALKTNVKLFKMFANIVFLGITAMSLYGMISTGMDLGKFIASIFTLLVAIVKLSLKLTKIIVKKINKKIAEQFATSITTYVDGKVQKSKMPDKVKEKILNKK